MLIHLDWTCNGFGKTLSLTHLLLAAGIFVMLENDKTFGLEQREEDFLRGSPDYEIVYPTRVDSVGQFVSNSVSHRVSRVQRRDTSHSEEWTTGLDQVFYRLQYGERDLHLNLTLNPHLLAPGFLTERRFGGLEGVKIRPHGRSLCHFIGEVWGPASHRGLAAISTCNGLMGLFKLSEEEGEFFIRPLERMPQETQSQAHAVYKRHVGQPRTLSALPLPEEGQVSGTCGLEDAAVGRERVEGQRERWERRRSRRRIRARSISREKWVETLVVADTKMVEYHGSKAVESYVLAVMNIVAGLFRDASIGNPINIVVVRLILLEQEEEDLKISHHADHSLSSFCKWQKRFNVKGDDHPVHHDVAVLLTRKDICAAINKPCETLGLSHVAGMCQPHRSCSISEDTGLPLAFTVAHELGHNFGIQHDGNGNDCEPIGKRPFIMSPQLLYGGTPPNWSRCSRQYITRFLDRGWGWCLDDAPGSSEFSQRAVLPGVLYSASHQCRLQYGSSSLLCDDVDNICSTLWCTVGNTCHSKLDGAADGTNCGDDKWCYDGECVPEAYRPESVNGGWASWSEWSACSRTCSIGVQHAERDCVNPTPRHGGKYCLGERRRYRICNNAPCPPDQPSFRLIQCSHFNNIPYKGKFYKWVEVNNRENPCELHCRPLNEYFSEKMLDAVVDGTRCYEGTSTRDVCINGICKNVGCDFKIDSNAVVDRCGVCHGNGSTCETVRRTFEDSEGLGYVDIGVIPEGAWDIRIEEVAEAGNFLALRSTNSSKYFLNGDWTIQWNGEYKAAGTVFTYERTGHLENLTSPGPTLEPVWIQLLFQETNPGVRYEYTISREMLAETDNDIVPDFRWQYGSWTECSTTCGTGVQRQIVHCVERTSGIVEEHYCDPATRPDDRRASCNEEVCPATWWVGEWQKCSSSCGDSGVARRTVLCIQSVALEEQRALQPSQCRHMPRPDSVTPCNTHIPCPADWAVGNWSECSVTCGTGLQSRSIICSNNTGAACDPHVKPKADLPCYAQDCPPTADIFGNDWSGSGSSSKEVFSDTNAIPEDNHLPGVGQGATRDHMPRLPADLSNSIEEDSSHHNQIDNGADNSIRNNVQIDDFYYDYNFIGFHEDLSYGFDQIPKAGDELVINPNEESGPQLISNNYMGYSTDVPATTSHTLVTSSKDGVYTPTTPHRTDDEQLGTAALPDLQEDEDQSGLQAKKHHKESENEEEVLYAEDHFLPTSSKPAPRGSSVQFSESETASNTERERQAESTDEETYAHSICLEPTPDHCSSTGKPGKTTTATHDVDVVPNSDLGAAVVNDNHWDGTDVASRVVVGEEMGGAKHLENSQGGANGGNWKTASPEDWRVPAVPKEATPTAESWNGVLPFVTLQVPPDSTAGPAHASSVEASVTTARPSSTGLFMGKEKFVFTTALSLEDEVTGSWPVLDEHQSTQHAPSLPVPTPSDPFDLVTGNRDNPRLARPTEARLVSPADLQDDLEFPAAETPSTQSVPRNTIGISITPAKGEGTVTDPSGPTWGEVRPCAFTAWPEIDFNEIQVLSVPTPEGLLPRSPGQPMDGDPDTIPAQDLGLAEPNAPILSSTPKADVKAYWVAENWSTCSTTCGLGAVWRSVRCSTGQDSDCSTSKRPGPARRCYLRPCSAWRVGEWSKCSRTCGGGAKHREVQCFNTRDGKPLRPFHCQAIATRPSARELCNNYTCVEWYTSSWGQCSELCGRGQQQRLVTCPEPGKCDDSVQPENIQTCNSQPCAQWVTGSWGQCSAPCGGGVQRRLVKCIDTRSEEQEEEDPKLCSHTPWPENTQKCNLHECSPPPNHQVCLRDRLTFHFCQTLQWLGRCHLPPVRAQCCRTCGQVSRGNERTSRR